MLGLKTLWSKGTANVSEAGGAMAPLASIPRQTILSPRPEAMILEPLQTTAFPTETRNAARFVPRRTSTVLVADNGKKIAARIINVSALGVAIEADFSQAPAQTIVMAGTRKVKPGRKIARGAVFLFETALSASLCGPEFIL